MSRHVLVQILKPRTLKKLLNEKKNSVPTFLKLYPMKYLLKKYVWFEKIGLVRLQK